LVAGTSSTVEFEVDTGFATSVSSCPIASLALAALPTPASRATAVPASAASLPPSAAEAPFFPDFLQLIRDGRFARLGGHYVGSSSRLGRGECLSLGCCCFLDSVALAWTASHSALLMLDLVRPCTFPVAPQP